MSIAAKGAAMAKLRKSERKHRTHMLDLMRQLEWDMAEKMRCALLFRAIGALQTMSATSLRHGIKYQRPAVPAPGRPDGPARGLL